MARPKASGRKKIEKKKIDALLEWLNSLPKATQDMIAKEMETTTGQLRQIAYGNRQCSTRLAVLLDKFSGGHVSMVVLDPRIDWNHIKLFIHAR